MSVKLNPAALLPGCPGDVTSAGAAAGVIPGEGGGGGGGQKWVRECFVGFWFEGGSQAF